MAQEFVFHTNRLNKSYGTKPVLKDITLSFYHGAKIGILGGNGSGKSTLLRIFAGIDKDFDGEAKPQPGIRIGYLPQEPLLDTTKDVRGNLEPAVKPIRDLLDEYNRISEKLATELSDEEMQKCMDRMTVVQEKIDTVNGWELDRMLEIAADALFLPPPETSAATLSGGERRRVALCKILLEKPDILLLDEPTNHLDAESVAWLEHHLREYPGAVLMVTHDRYFLDNVTTWILELDQGRGIPYQGNYTSWLEQKAKRIEIEQKQEDTRAKVLRREADWIKSSPAARRGKSKARIANYERMAAEETDERMGDILLRLPPGPHLGNRVLELKKVHKSYGDKLLIEDFTFDLPAGGIVGVIGPNGAGKTTLFRMIVGQETPDKGTLFLGDTVKLSYVDQNRDVLDPKKTVWGEVCDGQEEIFLGKQLIKSRVYLSRFNFKGSDQQKLVGELSGGERNRVHLAKLLKAGGNLILLDEPTNDLDVDTLRVLEEALAEFGGCVMIISHDRWFLDRIATHMISFEGDGTVRWFEGDYSAYEARRREELGDVYDRPHRSRYRKLTH